MNVDVRVKNNGVTSMESDEALVRRALEGDNRAYEFLIERHKESVARFIWRLVPVTEDREEICQDVFIKIYFNLHKFRFDSKFTTWLYKISWRTAISFLRKKRLPLDELHEDQDSGERSMESVSDDHKIAQIIEREISRLKLDERSILTLFHLQGMTIEDIGKIIGKPEGTVKSILHRVRGKLKVGLAELNPAVTIKGAVL